MKANLKIKQIESRSTSGPCLTSTPSTPISAKTPFRSHQSFNYVSCIFLSFKNDKNKKISKN